MIYIWLVTGAINIPFLCIYPGAPCNHSADGSNNGPERGDVTPEGSDVFTGGFNVLGYNVDGFDRRGFDKNGYKKNGIITVVCKF